MTASSSSTQLGYLCEHTYFQGLTVVNSTTCGERERKKSFGNHVNATRCSWVEKTKNDDCLLLIIPMGDTFVFLLLTSTTCTLEVDEAIDKQVTRELFFHLVQSLPVTGEEKNSTKEYFEEKKRRHFSHFFRLCVACCFLFSFSSAHTHTLLSLTLIVVINTTNEGACLSSFCKNCSTVTPG